ncbi:hypothetical protein GQ44DRAFT_83540 [Phaeosphaeriaceae sp. PMI808]|nr:hypothetical protein GQ44DRAFT_83540 [Phaeosphaeriaceae sp. PMI808]
MVALALKSIGHDIVILEKSPTWYSKECAAGLSLGPYAQKFFQFHMPCAMGNLAGPRGTILDDLVIKNTVIADAGSQFIHLLAPNEDQVWTIDWHVVYRELLHALLVSKGGFRIQTGTNVTDAYLREDGTWNVISENGEDEQADLLIGADGAYSTVRSLVLPGLEPQYDGYLVWQGRFSAENIPVQIEGVLEGRLVWVRMPDHYIILYATRNDVDVSVEWRWYYPYSETSSELENIMTDIHNSTHRRIVTPDLLQPRVWQNQLDKAKDDIPSWMQTLLRRGETPLVTKVTYFDGMQGSFHGGKLFLVGEAFHQIRPHSGASADTAAMQATWMRDMFSEQEFGPKYWDEQVLKYAVKKGERSWKFGCLGMKGTWPEGKLHHHLSPW